MIEIAAASEHSDAPLARDHAVLESLILQVERDGYASSVGETEANISAIALPIIGRGGVVGSLNIIFFRTSMTPQTAASRYLESLRAAVKSIEAKLSGMALDQPLHS